MNTSRHIAFLTLLMILSAFPVMAQNGYTVSTSDEYYSVNDVDKDNSNWGVVIGYVNKSWRCTYPSVQRREDFFGDPGKYLHGIQIGGIFTPSFDFGLGLRTGLFIEAYISRSRLITDFCDHFAESDLYIPLHAMYQIPFAPGFGLNIFGGMGFQWAMAGDYNSRVGTYYSWKGIYRPVYKSEKQEYGNGWPKSVNWQAECGLDLHYKFIALVFTYSFGLTDHGIQSSFDDGKTYVTATKSRQDKMQASLAFIF